MLTRNPVVRLNHAVAVAMATAPERGLALLDGEVARALADFHLFHSARADLLRRIGHWTEAAVAYDRAIELARTGPERRFLQRRRASLTD